MNEQESLLPERPGELLHLARRQKGLTRAEVGARLKCSEEVVAAMESGASAGLPPVYMRGFLKAYVKLLEIPEQAVGKLLGEAPRVEPEVRTLFPGAASSRPVDHWLRASSYVLASLLVGTLAWQIAHEVVRLTQADRTVTQGASAVRTDDAGSGAHVNASIAALEHMPPNLGDRAETAGRHAWEAMRGAESPLTENEYLLMVSTSADSWVEIRDMQGNVLEQDLFRGGDSRRYRGFGPFRITLGRTSAVELSVNGQPVDLAPFARDDVTQMLLDPGALAAETVSRRAEQ